MIPVKSSLIKAIDYDRDTMELTVEFKSGGRYVYRGFSLGMWDNFHTAESVGKFFAENIKGHYAYEKQADVG
jgi:hypothetical protein